MSEAIYQYVNGLTVEHLLPMCAGVFQSESEYADPKKVWSARALGSNEYGMGPTATSAMKTAVYNQLIKDPSLFNSEKPCK